jgi:hypothetical protein
MNSRKTVRRLEKCSEARQSVVMPCQGNKLSGGGHSILHRVSHVRRYAPADRVLEGLETEARESRKGLSADPQPVPPWEWRKRTR